MDAREVKAYCWRKVLESVDALRSHLQGGKHLANLENPPDYSVSGFFGVKRPLQITASVRTAIQMYSSYCYILRIFSCYYYYYYSYYYYYYQKERWVKVWSACRWSISTDSSTNTLESQARVSHKAYLHPISVCCGLLCPNWIFDFWLGAVDKQGGW